MLSEGSQRLLKVWAPRQALVGTPGSFSHCPKPPVSSEPSSGHGGGSALTHRNLSVKLHVLPEVLLTRKAPAWFQNPDKRHLGRTHLCPQTTATLGLAPHHQRIQPKSWEDLQLGADPQNCGQVLTQLNKIYKMETQTSTL